MVEKLNRATIIAYTTVASFCCCLKEDLKNDERGVSGIVVAVLLILVAVLAVVMLWGGLKKFISDQWTTITGQTGAGGITGGSLTNNP